MRYKNKIHLLCISPWSSAGQLKLISPLYRIYASLNWVGIDADNGLSLIRAQAII